MKPLHLLHILELPFKKRKLHTLDLFGVMVVHVLNWCCIAKYIGHKLWIWIMKRHERLPLMFKIPLNRIVILGTVSCT